MHTNTRIVMTGGNGDLGKLLAPKLSAIGADAISLDPVGKVAAGVSHIPGSILDRNLTRESIAGATLVVHIAAWHGFHAFSKSKTDAEFWDLNMTGTFNVLDSCVASGTRKLVFISSTSVDEWPDMYGMTKLLGEELCRAYAKREDIQVITLRPRAFVPWWNTNVYNSKEEWASWFARGAVHIDDVAEAAMLACVKLLETDNSMCEVLTLDGKQDFSAEEIEIWRERGGKSFLMERFPEYRALIESASFIPDEPPVYKDISRTKEVLGFMPRYGLYELFVEMFS